MARIPKHDYSMSALEEPKMWAVTYIFSERSSADEQQVDTWHITASNAVSALNIASAWCECNDNSGEWVMYEIIGINLIRRGE